MTAWADLRDDMLRPLLKDTKTTKKWSDEELLGYANWALDDLSTQVPLVCQTTFAADASTTAFDLPTDFISVVAVIQAETPLPRYDWEPGTCLRTSDTDEMGYFLDHPETGQLTFTTAPTADVTLVYNAYLPHMTAEGDLPIGRFRWMEEAIAFYACYLAHMRQGVSAASLEQWKTKRDLDVGNPLNLEAREWRLRYEQKVAANLRGGRP